MAFPLRVLPGILLAEVRTFLDIKDTAITRPAHLFHDNTVRCKRQFEEIYAITG